MSEVFGPEAVEIAKITVAERCTTDNGAAAGSSVFAHMALTQQLVADLGRLQSEADAARIRLDKARTAALAKERECDALFAEWQCAKEMTDLASEALKAHRKRHRWPF